MTGPADQTVQSEDASCDPEMEEHSTGLPGFRTWRGVYWFVLIFFVACVVLLKVLELAYS